MTTADVCIRGAGPVGATLALALARRGLCVQLVAPGPASGPPVTVPPAPADVRAYALNEASRQLLRSLKVWGALPADAVTAVHDMRVQGDGAARPGFIDGLIDFSAWSQGIEALAWIVDAAELDRALHTALSFSAQVHRATPDEAARDGAEPAPLQVLADGKTSGQASASRAALGVTVTRHAYAHSALAARLVGDQPHGQRAHQWFTEGAVLALLPMDRPEPGCSWALIWSQDPQRAQALHAAPAAELEQALAAATGGAVGALRLHGARALWPLSLARAQPVVGPGWALVGDAAHVVHPLAGQGLNLGLADVVALDQVLAAREAWRSLGDEGLLRRYARARAGDTWAMATVTDGLLQLFDHPAPAVRLLRNAGLSFVNRLGPLKRRLVAHAAGQSAAPPVP